MIRCDDVTILLTTDHDIGLANVAMLADDPVTLKGHHGYVIDTKIHTGDGVKAVAATIRHIGPQTCACRRYER